MGMEARHIHLLGATGQIRTELFEGREHFVVPVVALMEGVIHAINATTPEFVPLSSLASAPSSWNGRPLMLGHPTRSGKQISANEAKILESQSFGTVFNARVEGKKLLMDAFIDPVKAESVGGSQIIEKLQNGEMIEVSVGALVATSEKPGVYNGKPYKAEWGVILPDHLAFLPNTVGACSIKMGCGTPREAEQHPIHMVVAEELEVKAEKTEKPQTEAKPSPTPSIIDVVRTKIKGVVGKFKAAAYGDSASEAASEEAAELIGYRTIQILLDQIKELHGEAYKINEDLISDEKDNPALTSADEEAEEEVETARLEAIQTLCMSIQSSLYSVMDMAHNLLQKNPDPARYMAGARHSYSDKELIQKVHDHSVKLGAQCEKEVKAAEESKIVELKAAEKGEQMTKEQRAELIRTLVTHKHSGFAAGDEKLLEAASDERLESFRAGSEARAKEVVEKPKEELKPEVKVETKVAETKPEIKEEVKEEVKKEVKIETKAAEQQYHEMTEEEFLKVAPASIRSLIARQQKHETELKANLVAELKTAQSEYKEAELLEMSIESLERLSRIANVETKVDFSGRSFPRAAAEQDVYANPPNPYGEEALKAHRESIRKN